MSAPHPVNRSGQILVGICVVLMIGWMAVQISGVITTNALITILVPATLLVIAGLALAWDFESNQK